MLLKLLLPSPFNDFIDPYSVKELKIPITSDRSKYQIWISTRTKSLVLQSCWLKIDARLTIGFDI